MFHRAREEERMAGPLNSSLHVRLAGVQLAMIEKVAKSKRLSVSQYVREELVASAKRTSW
jgi:hypothetical protein